MDARGPSSICYDGADAASGNNGPGRRRVRRHITNPGEETAESIKKVISGEETVEEEPRKPPRKIPIVVRWEIDGG